MPLTGVDDLSVIYRATNGKKKVHFPLEDIGDGLRPDNKGKGGKNDSHKAGDGSPPAVRHCRRILVDNANHTAQEDGSPFVRH